MLHSYIRVDFQLEQSSLSMANYKSEKATGIALLHLYRKLLFFTEGLEFEGNAQPSAWEVSVKGSMGETELLHRNAIILYVHAC